MTAKEQRKMRKYEIRIEELERHFKTSQDHYVDTFHSLFESRCALREAYELIFEAATVLNKLMGKDPAFMQLRGELRHDLNGDF